MARAKTKPIVAAEASPTPPRRLLRSKGPLSASETEIVVYAGLKNGEIAATPEAIQINSRAIYNLITDRASIAEQIAHKHFHQVADVPALRSCLLGITFGRHKVSANDNQAAIAGSLDLIDSALPDAFKIVLFLDDPKAALPDFLSDWKASKPDNRTSPSSITLVRF